MCRGRISKTDYLSPALWAAYGSHWKSHILAVIRARQAELAPPTVAVVSAPAPAMAVTPLLAPTRAPDADAVLLGKAGAVHPVIIPASALNWTSDSTASTANAGGRNRSSSGGAAGSGDDAGDATTDSSSVGGGAGSSEDGMGAGSSQDGMEEGASSSAAGMLPLAVVA